MIRSHAFRSQWTTPLLVACLVTTIFNLAVIERVQAANDFVVFGKEGVWIKRDSTVLSGDVGANVASGGPYFTGDYEVTIGLDARFTNPTSRIMGDTMRLKRGSQVQDVSANTLKGPGQVFGTLTSPVDLPLVSSLPLIPSVAPGTQDIDVSNDGILSLDAGHYGFLTVGKRATVTLTGGEYHFRKWNIRREAKVYATASVDIRVAEHLETRSEVLIGPAPNATTLTAADVKITGIAINGTLGNFSSTPKAVKFGVNNTLRANVYAPNGTLWVKQDSTAKGAFVGRWVRMGTESTITLEGGFGLGSEESNVSPVADAGPDQTVQVTDVVQLDGSGSTDVNGDLLTFTWAIVSKPVDSAATLSDPAAVMPTFAIDVPGTYEFQLIVRDGAKDSHPDIVEITTLNSPPVADAGSDQTVFVTQTVFLDGTNSSDVDNDMLTFLWSFVSMPSGSTATLSEPASPTPSFSVDRSGTYEVQLTVNDGTDGSVSETVVINTQNSKPVAVAGSDQTVAVGNIVQLDGRASSDVDGQSLTYMWSLTARPTGSDAMIADPTLAQPAFVLDLPGIYVAQLIVNDGAEDSDPATVTITAGNIPPIAEAGEDQLVSVHSLVSLNGTNSQDVDGGTLTFQWTLSSQPVGSGITLLNPTFAEPTMIPDLPGTYVVQLRVSDGMSLSLPDTTVIMVQDTPPAGMPELLITNPSSGTVITVNPITVSGVVSDPTATVSVNGIPATVTGGVFLADGIVLQEGRNTLTVIGTDGEDHTNQVSEQVTLASASPFHLDPLWGPIEWVKQTSNEEVFTANFANCEPLAQYQLVIINGTSGGGNRVAQGTVVLNGVEVVSALDLTAAQSQVNQPVVVQATNDLEVRLNGPFGVQVQAFITCTANCLSLSIDSPLANETINQFTMMVKGTITSSSVSPIGVVVNQQAAKVAGTVYAVDRVFVRGGTETLGPTTIVAEAVNACGQRASTSRQVQTTEVTTEQVRLRASPDRNITPSEVTLRASVELERPVVHYQWDFQGDGTIDTQGPDLAGQTVTFIQPGLYMPTVIVTDEDGETFESTAVVVVEEPADFEATLNAKWSEMMTTLAQGDIDRALFFIFTTKREVMRHDWTVMKGHLKELTDLLNVPLQLADGQGTRVIMKSVTPIAMGTMQFPLEVEFVVDTDGQWRVKGF
ncbi:PKD domain-containing protein [Candidatus Nitrospira salsa]